jgi:hypothetical protein
MPFVEWLVPGNRGNEIRWKGRQKIISHRGVDTVEHRSAGGQVGHEAVLTIFREAKALSTSIKR